MIYRIMFVCHGNICRSPMAEFIMKMLIGRQGTENEFFISSSATSTEEIWDGIGNPVYPPAKAVLDRHGICCDGKRAVQLTKSDYDKYDLFIGMDGANIRNMNRIFGEDPNGKIHKLLEFANRDSDISDPWYSRDFDMAFREIYEGCEGLLKYLVEGNK